MSNEKAVAFPKDLYVIVKVENIHGQSIPTYRGEPFF